MNPNILELLTEIQLLEVYEFVLLFFNEVEARSHCVHIHHFYKSAMLLIIFYLYMPEHTFSVSYVIEQRWFSNTIRLFSVFVNGLLCGTVWFQMPKIHHY